MMPTAINYAKRFYFTYTLETFKTLIGTEKTL